MSDLKSTLKALLNDEPKYKDINFFWDINIPSNSFNYSSSKKIDLIATTSNSIIVFNIKKYNADINGTINNEIWISCYESGSNFPIANPYIQNRKKIKILSRYLGLPKEFFKSTLIIDCNNFNIDVGMNSLIKVDNHLNDNLDEILKSNLCNFTKSDLDEINLKLLKTDYSNQCLKRYNLQ